MQQSVSISASPELLHARWWPQGWWRIVDMRIGIIPIPIYVILVALLAGFTYTGDIKGEISIMIAILVIGASPARRSANARLCCATSGRRQSL